MCRLFAVRADRPVSAFPALVTAPHALAKQSCGDRRGECHREGWGVGSFAGGTPARVRSTGAAGDARYEAAARVVGETVIGHVRQASIGRVSELNTHPFAHGKWLFVHNGTVEGFAADPGPLLALIPGPLRGAIEGETDSEHLMFALLGRLERAGAAGEAVAAELARLLDDVAKLYPGTPDGPTQLNVVLSDGAAFVASRWGHTLYRADLDDPEAAGIVETADGAPARGVAVASEPVTPAGWREVPDHCVIWHAAEAGVGVMSGRPYRLL